jgi:hypothetical protein
MTGEVAGLMGPTRGSSVRAAVREVDQGDHDRAREEEHEDAEQREPEEDVPALGLGVDLEHGSEHHRVDGHGDEEQRQVRQ